MMSDFRPERVRASASASAGPAPVLNAVRGVEAPTLRLFFATIFLSKNNHSPLRLQTSTILLVYWVHSPFSLQVHRYLFCLLRPLSLLSTAVKGYR